MRVDKLEIQSADDFLKIADQFKLGILPTESQNPKSLNLSHDAQNNPIKAIETIRLIDMDILPVMNSKSDELSLLMSVVKRTLESGANIYLCGCGATGRLSLALETIWRVIYEGNKTLEGRVISFMAGGDVALINSVEKFEDFPEYGARQLTDLNFKEGDLLIAITEGGETPFVIGACEKAQELSSNTPYFIYCNPDDILCAHVERSKNIITNPKINKINLTVGPMALTGSTRMQATTIQMYFVGLALFYRNSDIETALIELNQTFLNFEKTDLSFLEAFVKKEADIYKKGEFLLYETNELLGISILTDTTERSPTFSLHPFENKNDKIKNPSLSYLFFPHAKNKEAAWELLLKRKPRPFHWEEVTDRTSSERLYGFDFSENLLSLRAEYLKKPQHRFKIYFDENSQVLSFELDDLKHALNLSGRHFLSVHMVLKMILNNLSTTIMGNLGRYESNLMTWVRSSNNKLIDRSVRYARTLLKNEGIDVGYEELVRECFKLKDMLSRDQALVLEIVKKYSKK